MQAQPTVLTRRAAAAARREGRADPPARDVGLSRRPHPDTKVGRPALEALGMLVPFLLGIVAARRRLLEEPGRHRVLLRFTAAVGIGAAVAAGLPLGLTVAGVLPAGANLAQSVVWTLVFAPYALDLSDDLGVASTAVLALGTWLATVGPAELMRRRGSRGPAEVLLRRLTYR